MKMITKNKIMNELFFFFLNSFYGNIFYLHYIRVDTEISETYTEAKQPQRELKWVRLDTKLLQKHAKRGVFYVCHKGLLSPHNSSVPTTIKKEEERQTNIKRNK